MKYKYIDFKELPVFVKKKNKLLVLTNTIGQSTYAKDKSLFNMLL